MADQMKKSFKKRIRVTKTGKVIRRQMGLGHSRAKKSRTTMQRKKNLVEVSGADLNFIIKNIR